MPPRALGARGPRDSILPARRLNGFQVHVSWCCPVCLVLSCVIQFGLLRVCMMLAFARFAILRQWQQTLLEYQRDGPRGEEDL